MKKIRTLTGCMLLVVLLPHAGATPQPAQKPAHQKPAHQRRVRARTPKFDSSDVSRVFFDDLFARLVGQRPPSVRGNTTAKASSKGPSGSPIPSGSTPAAGGADTHNWSERISAATLEDEVKSLKTNVDKTVTTPSSFAGRGHKDARLDFTLLATLFAVIDQFDGDVRWKDSAALARDVMARTAANLKAGGSIQVYNESKKRKQDLDDLVRGSRLQGTGSDEMVWSDIADRSPLMQLLESRFESNLKSWTSNGTELRTHSDDIVHEAELTAMIGAVLLREGMDDADDDEYRPFAEMLARGGTRLVQAAKAQDEEAARKAMASISRSCVDCHDNYR